MEQKEVVINCIIPSKGRADTIKRALDELSYSNFLEFKESFTFHDGGRNYQHKHVYMLKIK